MKTNENAENGNWIKLFRNFQKWEWYKDSVTKDVFIDLLLEAQWKDSRYMGNEIKRGQLITSVEAIKNRTGLSTQNIRTALAHLEKTGEINKQTNKQFTLVTICKYESYQGEDYEANKQPNNQPTNDQQTTNNIQERNNDNNNSFYKEVKEESPRGIPSGTLSGTTRKEAPRSRSESSSRTHKKLSSNLRIKNVSYEELILFVNTKILKASLGDEEENRLKELYSQYSPEEPETMLVTFALKLLKELNGTFALKFKKEYASKIAPEKKKPFDLDDVFPFLYGDYSKKSVEMCKKKIKDFYSRLEGQDFKNKSGNEVDLPWFVKWLEKNLELKTREQEAPFTKEDLRKALPNEDERVIERLESKYDAYFRQGNWETKSGYPVTLDMFTGFFRKTIIEELKSEGYVPKKDKTISRDGRKYFDPSKDADELVKRGFGRSKN